MTVPDVRVETVALDSAGGHTTALLRDRHDDIEAVVGEAAAVLRASAAKLDDQHGWRISSVEAKFGLTLTAEADIILSKASAEASFEVTITLDRSGQLFS